MSTVLNLAVAGVLFTAAGVLYRRWGLSWRQAARTAAKEPLPQRDAVSEAMREAADAINDAPLIPTQPGYRDATYRQLEAIYALPAHDPEGESA